MRAFAISHGALRRCAHRILCPTHWRPDGTCRCDDPTHSEAHRWGYRWDAERGRWVLAS